MVSLASARIRESRKGQPFDVTKLFVTPTRDDFPHRITLLGLDSEMAGNEKIWEIELYATIGKASAPFCMVADRPHSLAAQWEFLTRVVRQTLKTPFQVSRCAVICHRTSDQQNALISSTTGYGNARTYTATKTANFPLSHVFRLGSSTSAQKHRCSYRLLTNAIIMSLLAIAGAQPPVACLLRRFNLMFRHNLRLEFRKNLSHYLSKMP
jgi:hypothetical protein